MLRSFFERTLRPAEKNNSSALLVFAPVCGIASAGTYPKYAPADATCRRTQIRRHLVELFFSAILSGPFRPMRPHPELCVNIHFDFSIF
jgi:hypothetical protein